MWVMMWCAYFAPVTNATFPVRSGISREGSYCGLENKKPMLMTMTGCKVICEREVQFDIVYTSFIYVARC